MVDTSSLKVKTSSGAWRYRSVDFLRRMRVCKPFEVRRNEMLSILAILFANLDVDIPVGAPATSGSQRELCVGVVGKRVVLTNSLLRSCASIEEIGRFVILDVDAGGIPRNAEGLVLTGISTSLPTWEDGLPPATHENIELSGSQVDCTRHIETDWDGIPERLLLCDRYRGRRIASLNPGAADMIFIQSSIPVSTPRQDLGPFGPAYECTLDDIVTNTRLATPGRGDADVPVVVQSKGNPCLRYAAAAWYSSCGEVVLINGDLHRAFESARTKRESSFSKGRALVLVA